MDRYICIHGHFYQPPRENAWLEEVELQDSAYPYHDWNERITAECYAPNTASRILDAENSIIEIVNNYSKISFNFGPTLLYWLERHKPDVYKAIQEADQLSQQRFSGHGSALAQVYNHMIMPLANSRDKYTQAFWGVRDFQKRFARSPEGMWLPETAVDVETLEILAGLRIKFVILAPRQASRVKKMGRGGRWFDVSNARIDPTMPYLCRLPSGKKITLFFYDGPISRDIAFGGLLNNGEAFANRLLNAFTQTRDWPQMVHVATDGETYGHHHRYGEMALAYCLYYIESNNLAKLTNYGEYLEKHPPTHQVEIFQNSSWSCVHGVERWRDNCGCNTGMHAGWTQGWRKPLKEAVDWVRDQLVPMYEVEASKYLKNPWEARNHYVDVLLNRSGENVEAFLKKHAVKPLSKEEKVRVLKLLEMQKNSMFMYTSCGWFFDEISGIETTQVMQYAAKAMQLAEELHGVSLEPEYVSILERAPSNVYQNGAQVHEMFVNPARLDLLRVGAHYAISSLFEEYSGSAKVYCYTAEREVYDKVVAGKLKLAIGRTRIVSDVTWDESTVSFAVLHLGDHNINGGVRSLIGEETFSAMQAEIRLAFDRGDIPEVIRLMDKHFGTNNYSIWHLFKDEQRKVLNQILDSTLREIEVSFRRIYETNYPIMSFLQSLGIPLPKPLSVVAEYMVNADLKRFYIEDSNMEKLDHLINEAKKWSLEIDRTTIEFVLSEWIGSLMEGLYQQPDDIARFEKIESILRLLGPLSIDLDLWKAQNIYFSIGKSTYAAMKSLLGNGNEPAKRWVEAFRRLGDYLHVKVP